MVFIFSIRVNKILRNLTEKLYPLMTKPQVGLNLSILVFELGSLRKVVLNLINTNPGLTAYKSRILPWQLNQLD